MAGAPGSRIDSMIWLRAVNMVQEMQNAVIKGMLTYLADKLEGEVLCHVIFRVKDGPEQVVILVDPVQDDPDVPVQNSAANDSD